MARSHSRRGSAAVYVLLVVISLAAVIMALTSVGGERFRNQVRAERALQAQYAFEGALAQLRSEIATGATTAPETKTVTVGDYSCNVTVSVPSPAKANTYKVDQTIASGGYTFKSSRLVGIEQRSPILWDYALFSSQSMALNDVLTITGANSNVWVGGPLTVNASGSTVEGSVFTSSGSIPAGIDIGGKRTNQTAVSFPNVGLGSNYLASANAILTGLQNLLGGLINLPFHLTYVLGDVNLSGTYTGKITIFSTGNVNITGNVVRGSPDSELVVIANGQIRNQTSSTSIFGYYFGGNGFIISKPLNVDGALAGKSFTLNAPLTIAFDPTVMLNNGEGTSLKLPTLWP